MVCTWCLCLRHLAPGLFVISLSACVAPMWCQIGSSSLSSCNGREASTFTLYSSPTFIMSMRSCGRLDLESGVVAFDCRNMLVLDSLSMLLLLGSLVLISSSAICAHFGIVGPICKYDFTHVR